MRATPWAAALRLSTARADRRARRSTLRLGRGEARCLARRGGPRRGTPHRGCGGTDPGATRVGQQAPGRLVQRRNCLRRAQPRRPTCRLHRQVEKSLVQRGTGPSCGPDHAAGTAAAGSVPRMVRPLGLPFDPIERAGQTGRNASGPPRRCGPRHRCSGSSRSCSARYDDVLKPHELTSPATRCWSCSPSAGRGAAAEGDREPADGAPDQRHQRDRPTGRRRGRSSAGRTRTTAAACSPASPTTAARVVEAATTALTGARLRPR